MAESVTTLTPEEFVLLTKLVGDIPGAEHLTAGIRIAEPVDPRVAKILTMPPEVSFLTTKIPPPSPFYLAREDQLLVSIWNSVPGAVISLGARFLRPDGVIVPVVRTFTPTADRSLNSFTIPPTEGYLLGLHAGTMGVPQAGMCYITVLVNRPQAPAGTELHALLAGYVTNSFHPSWPNSPLRDPRDGQGNLRLVSVLGPGSGVEMSVTVPTGARWRIVSYAPLFTTSAAVPVRTPRLYMTIAGVVVAVHEAPSTQAASLVRRYSWVAGLGYAQAPVVNSVLIGLPPSLIIPAGGVIATLTDGMDPGDIYSTAGLTVEEWIEP